MPDKETISSFIMQIYNKSQMEKECILMVLVYVGKERKQLVGTEFHTDFNNRAIIRSNERRAGIKSP